MPEIAYLRIFIPFGYQAFLYSSGLPGLSVVFLIPLAKFVDNPYPVITIEQLVKLASFVRIIFVCCTFPTLAKIFPKLI